MRKIIYTIFIIFFVVSALYAGGRKESPAPAGQSASGSTSQTDATAAQNGGSTGGGAKAGGAGTSTANEQTPTLNGVQQALADVGISPFREGVHSVDFTIQTLDGKKRSLSDYRGKVVFLNFWATWCPPCRAEMPSMQTLYTAMKGKDFDIVAVNVQENAEAVHSFMKSEQTDFTFPILLDGSGRVASTYSVRGIPTTYIVGKEGQMLGMVVGGKDWADPKIIDTFTSLAENRTSVSSK
ncbi:TlpA disulfide reductase family protein [Salinispira pacifica]